MTYRGISILAFCIVLGGIGLHALLFPFGPGRRWGIMAIFRTKIHVFTLLFLEQKLNWIGRLKKLILLLAMLSFLVLLLTGFGPLVCGCRLHGWLLMVHATFAPVFIGCVALLALGWAQGMAFEKEEAAVFSAGCCFRKPIDGCWLTDSGIGQKCCFWALIFLALPVTLSMIVSMFPLLGTHGQELLFHLHRWSALALACVAIVFLYVLIRRQIVKENKQEHI